jgi:hypothetical protein
MKSVFCFIIILFLQFFVAEAQEFRAYWISADTVAKSTPNSWYCYRKNVHLQHVPRNLKARIAVDTKYWLWVNGKLVVYEGGLKRGPDPLNTYYDEVDLSPHFQKGKNTIALLVWFWGGAGFSHHNSGRTGLLFEGSGDEFTLLSDSTWKAVRYEAYQPSTAPMPNFRLSEPNILYDARNERENWFASSFDDSRWPAASVLGRVPMAPWNHLVKRNIPLFRFGSLKPYPKTERRGDTVVCYLPYNGHFSAYIKLKAAAGQKVFMASDTYYLGALSPTDSLYTHCSEYITKDGEQQYESLLWIAGHQMHYVLPKGVELLSVQYRETGYDTDFAGSFHSGDPFLDRLWKKAQRSLYVNMRDNYMDCPDRERAQWAGDAAMEMAQAFYSLDRRSDSLSRKLFLDLANWQRPDSVIYNPVPETAWKNELPAHSLMPISELWRYYLYTRDTATVRKIYPAFRKYLLLWDLQPNGQLVYRKGGWDWGDWGENKDLVLIQHGWYVLAAQTAARVAALLGMEADKKMFRLRIGSLKQFLNSSDCWNGTAYRHKHYQGATDDRANALMVMSGVAERPKWDAVTQVFLKEEHASPYMEKFVLESLIKMEKPELALSRMKKRFREMVENPLTTLWEIWEYKPGEAHGNSGYNHGWSGGPLVLLSQYYAGLAPDEEKQDQWVIKPRFAGLKNIEASVPTTRGLLTVSMRKRKDALLSSYVVPLGLTVKAGLPKSGVAFRQLMINNKKIGQQRFVRTAGEDKDYLWVQLPAGKYQITAR